MARLRGPLLSFGAEGQIAKTMVTATWRGVKYAREYVVPANPRTQAQQDIRTLFAYLREMWKLAPAEVLATWNSFAQGRPFTGMNKFIGENVRVMKFETDMNNFIGSPGSKGGLPPVTFNAATGTSPGEVVATFTVPSAPPGWALTKAVAVAFPDADPTGIFTGPFVQGTDNSSPYEITLGGLGAGVACQVAGWLVWTKPNGDLAYSVGITDQATSDA